MNKEQDLFKNTSDEDLRNLLQEEFLKRMKKNPQFSMRAFAQILDLDSGHLSRILAGKRGVGSKIRRKMLANLQLDVKTLESLVSLKKKEIDYKTLTIEHFKLISDWYHYAILELTRISEFKSDHKWIAKKLNISVNQVNMAVERLFKLGFMAVDENQNYVDKSGDITTVGNDFTNAAFKNLQKQVLQMGIEAIENTDYSRRSQSSVTYAMNSQDLPEIKKRIREFEKELTAFIERDCERDSVYQLGISFYPLTKLGE